MTRDIAMAKELKEKEVDESFSEIIKPIQHDRAVHYVLTQLRNHITENNKKGEINVRQT